MAEFTRTPRVDWEGLPLALREAVAEQVGPPAKVETIVEGRRTPLVATFTTRSGDRLFVKAAPDDGTRAGEQLARELAIAPYLTAIAPELLYAAEAGGWRLAAFEWVDGTRANYMIDSPDIPKVLQTLADLDRLQVPPDVPLIWFERRWSSYAPAGRELTRLAGPALLHTDINPTNLRIGPAATLVDWAAASRGARFVNPADFVICLIASGHPPRDAEASVSDLLAWRDADPLDIDYYARTVATAWLHAFGNLTNPWAKAVMHAAQQWAMHRHDQT
ncbi:hypothetical protein ABZ801_17975 [Actinomadura sp. NPDC047616]|uniref:hypothetical protein n=1 Tax=Actinomadura sp. NPDC047616 TaxID=3155914 RepID=UPI0033D175BD